MADLLVAIMLLAAGVLAQPTQFDVATIKPSNVTDGIFTIRTLPGGRLSCWGVILKLLVMEAYGAKAFQISGGQSWVGASL